MALAGLFEETPHRRRRRAAACPAISRDDRRQRRWKSSPPAARQRSRYHRVTNFLAATVMREGEAVLARNVVGDSSIGSRDSKGEIHATSVHLRPVRRGRKVLGLLHLYSTNADQVPDPDDLEFTLAVADTVAVALTNLNRRQELAENLNQVRSENVQLRERLGVQSEIVGQSAVIRRITEEIARAAASKATRADPRRERRGQGAGRPGGPLFQPADEERLRLPELRRPLGRPAGQRVVRPRAGRVHRGHRPQDRQVRGRPPGHADAGRDRRDEPGHPGQVPPRAGRASLRAGRRQQADPGRRAGDRRHQPRPGEGRGRRPLPPRPLLPPPRAGDRRARLAQAARGHPRAGQLFPAASSTAETGRKIRGFTPRGHASS